MNKKRINNTIKLIILFFLSISLFLSCEKNDIFDTAVTKPVVVASDHPVFSHDSGIYPPGTIVTITCTTPGATIRYTDDGTDPKTSGTAVEGPSPLVYNVSGVNNHTVIKAFTYTAGMWDSDRFSAIIVKNYTMEKAAAPVISHASQTFIASTAPTITITSLTVTAGFKYTIDGTDPKVSGTAMTAAQPLNMDLLNDLTYRRNINLRIIAVAPGYNDSDEVTRTYIVQIDTPVLTAPLPLLQNNDITVTSITCAAVGSSIYYTLDGSVPTTLSTLYSGSFTITNNSLANLRIIAFRSGSTPSTEVSRAYTLQAAQPSLSPGAGASYTGNNDYNITMTTGTTGAEIRYTVDNSPPTAASTLYTVPIPANLSFMVRAKAFRANYQDSIEASRTYNLRVGNLTVSTAGGTYSNDRTISSITTATIGATIKYTVGTVILPPADPTLAVGTIWTETVSSISINSTDTVVKVRAFKTNYVDSNLSTQTYILKVATPAIDHATGIYNNDFTAIASTTTTGASLYYSTDGSAPVTAFGGSLLINSSSQFRVVGKKAGYVDSDISPADYTMVALDPTFAPAVGFYPGPGPLNVTLATGTTTATIYYTTDGSDPTTLSNLYPIAGIDILSTTTLRFAAFKSGYTTSNIIQMTITEAAGDFTVTSP